MTQDQCDACQQPRSPRDVAAAGKDWLVIVCPQCGWAEFYRVPTPKETP